MPKSSVGDDDRVGDAVAVGVDMAIVGAPGRDTFAGAALVYKKAATGWRFVQQTTGTEFGSSAAIQGDTIATKSHRQDRSEGHPRARARIAD